MKADETTSIPTPKQLQASLTERSLNSLNVVVVGASAGGLRALTRLIGDAATLGAAMIIVQHSKANSEVQTKASLAVHTALPVTVAKTGMTLSAGTVHVVPPSCFFDVEAGRVKLTERGKLNPKDLPIDHAFVAVAKAFGAKSTGVILSGAGSDGAKGLRAIADAGGLCLVQSPATAEHSSMPEHAQKASGAKAAEPELILQLIKRQVETRGRETARNQQNSLKDDYRAIFEFLTESYAVDFSYYRTATLERRLEYRLTQLDLDAAAYLERLRLDAKESKFLIEFILVVVTEFFRDADAFTALQQRIIEPLVATGDQLRVWVPACATGQEAYSLAIALTEAFENAGKEPDFKIFATDLSERSLKLATAGRYVKAAMQALPQQLINRYFTDSGDYYQVTESLRRTITFAKHNVYSDPPFTRLQLISCRNLLMYFKEAARQAVLGRFHYCLQPEGYLFLGSGETVDTFPDGFKTIDDHWPLYQKHTCEQVESPDILTGLSARHKTKYVRTAARDKNLERLALLAQLAPTGFLVNEMFELVETFGDAHKWLSFPEGRVELNLFALLTRPLLQAVRSSLRQTAKGFPNSSLLSDESGNYSLTSKRINVANEDYYFVQLTTVKGLKKRVVNSTNTDGEALARIEELEHELERKEDQLQTTIEELETTNEELMSSNEELMSSNEELQSVNEELNSVNEELHTVNTEYQGKLHAVTQANNDLINLQNVAQIGTVFVDKNMRIRSYSPLLTKRFNFLPQDVGRPVEHLIHCLNTELNFFRSALSKAVEGGQVSEFEAFDSAMTPYWVRLMPYLNSEGSCEGAVLSLTEITQLKQAQARLEENSRFSENLIAATPGINYIYVFGEGRRTFAGNDFSSALGYQQVDERKNPKFLTSIMHNDDRQRLSEHNERLALSKKGEVVPFEFRVKHADDYWVWMESRETVHKRDKNGDLAEVLGIALDISSHKRTAERLQHDALHDALTGLRNRLAFTEHLNQTHKDFLRYPDQTYAVLFIDLDRFKVINDSYGHAAGDHVLKVTAQRLEAMVREVDVVARHSGDEFLVLLKNTSSERETEKMAERLISAVEEPIYQDELCFEISASIGIALSNPEQNLPEFLISSADIAMYKSKKGVGKKVHIFDDSLHLATMKQVSLEQDLRVALRGNKLRVHYQPIFDIQTRQVVALEALARWPQGKRFITPDQFIPLAEAAHLIGKVDKTVFNQACQFLKGISDPTIKVNINLSASQLTNPNTIEFLLKPSVNPQRICLEITESQLLLKNTQSVVLLEKLNEVGYNLAIDDFGTGYSSLAYLQSLPAKTLKIDRSFVQSIEKNPKSKAIIAAIMNLAKTLNYKVVAEGIETEAQLAFVKTMNCDFAQGYLFSKPLSPQDCSSLVNAERLVN